MGTRLDALQIITSIDAELKAEVFAFDAMIQNPDRKASNPNCVYRGKELRLFDHELAFSHLLDIMTPVPWDDGDLRFLREHIFFPNLRANSFGLERFRTALAGIGDGQVAKYGTAIPSDWSGEMRSIDRVLEYTTACIKHFPAIQSRLEALLS